MQHCIFLAYSVGESSVSGFFSLLALKLSQKYTVVIFSDRKNELPFFSGNVILLNWPSPRPTKFRDFLFLLKQIRKYQPQLMLSTFGANNVFLVGGFFGGVPHRLATHRTISSHFASNALKLFRKKMVFKLATEVMTNSNATKIDLTTTFKVPAHKIFVTYNAVENPGIERIKDPDLLVYAGRLSAKKGTDVLLDAFAMVSHLIPELHLMILGGTSSEVEFYQHKAKGLGLEASIEFLGSRPQTEVLEHFAKAAFVIVPSLSEGFGFVVIEAFSVKTVVIGSNTGGIKEIIRHGTDGLLFEPGSASDLSRTIVEMHADIERRKEMESQAHQRFLDTFELNTVVQELAAYLSEKITTKA